jgi:hypothetical protein
MGDVIVHHDYDAVMFERKKAARAVTRNRSEKSLEFKFEKYFSETKIKKRNQLW